MDPAKRYSKTFYQSHSGSHALQAGLGLELGLAFWSSPYLGSSRCKEGCHCSVRKGTGMQTLDFFSTFSHHLLLPWSPAQAVSGMFLCCPHLRARFLSEHLASAQVQARLALGVSPALLPLAIMGRGPKAPVCLAETTAGAAAGHLWDLTLLHNSLAWL